MYMKKYTNYILILLTFTLCCCESMKETYEEYAGDGRIRYLAKCSNLEGIPRWESVKLSWENGIDPAIDHILIEWNNGFTRKDTVTHKDSSSIVIPGLENYTYEFKVFSVDQQDNRSIESIVYTRPYTTEHEYFGTISGIVFKHFKVGNDNLVLFFDPWSDHIKEGWITYHNGDSPQKLKFTRELIEEKYHMLTSVDFSQSVNIYRRIVLPDGDDEVLLPAYELDLTVRTFKSDFSALIKNYLGVDELTDEVIQNVTELEIDYNVSSLEDILYFPNLRKLSLGKNRFMSSTVASEFPSQILETESSKFSLKSAHEINSLSIDRYDVHYFNYKINSWDKIYLPENLPYINEKGSPVLPTLN